MNKQMQLQRISNWIVGGLCLATVLVSGACVSSPGALGDGGYVRPKYGLRILYKDVENRRFINADWRVDNFYRNQSGEWNRKKGRDYYGIRLVEDDRRGGVKKEKIDFFELKLSHRTTGAVIWMQTFKLKPRHRDMKLDVLLNNYARSLSGSGLFVEGNIYGLLQLKIKKHAAVVRAKKWVRVNNSHALRARIEIVNLDRARVDPRHRGRTVEVVLLRFYWTTEDELQSRKNPNHWVKYRFYHPVVMVIGYKSSATYFEKHRSDFQAFLQQIRFRRHGRSALRPSSPRPVLSRPLPIRLLPPRTSPPRRKFPRPQPPRKNLRQPGMLGPLPR